MVLLGRDCPYQKGVVLKDSVLQTFGCISPPLSARPLTSLVHRILRAIGLAPPPRMVPLVILVWRLRVAWAPGSVIQGSSAWSPGLDGFGCRWAVVRSTVWPHRVVVSSPTLDEYPGLQQRIEELHVEQPYRRQEIVDREGFPQAANRPEQRGPALEVFLVVKQHGQPYCGNGRECRWDSRAPRRSPT